MEDTIRTRVEESLRSAAAPILEKLGKKKLSNDELQLLALYLISSKLDEIRNTLDEISRSLERLNELPVVIKAGDSEIKEKLGEVLDALQRMITFSVEEA
ncbi:MAG: hypothetical protein TU35_007515 [Thermoproteus sp. AZ2]|jgi:protein subunit release factor A|uniref:Uncharacterized protein n=1 Tax=Thermoproteus sp. AZ2 TaxID=1609232 RepID=A0ACC6V249_9CREN|nr:MAG: hypothetical protein TU35_03930 [Thermoproteus sp. AZ2]